MSLCSSALMVEANERIVELEDKNTKLNEEIARLKGENTKCREGIREELKRHLDVE